MRRVSSAGLLRQNSKNCEMAFIQPPQWGGKVGIDLYYSIAERHVSQCNKVKVPIAKINNLNKGNL